jgi:hypothetical protein
MREAAEESLPFRWDLIAPDQLGSLLAGTGSPDLWFLDELVACAGKVLARSGNDRTAPNSQRTMTVEIK